MKRLIVCSDGTWQDLKSDYPTNVVKLLQAIQSQGEDGVEQIVFYDEGIGTQGLWDKALGGALGKGITRNILDCYRFLVLNYTKGDEVYFFGFSRGSYTVRSLAGLVYGSGIVKREHIRQIPQAYSLYQDRSIHPDDTVAQDFRTRYVNETTLNLLGCFDTVGSLGVPQKFPWSPFFNKKYMFHDTKLNPKILNALHAVAIDENRKVFDVTRMTKNMRAPKQNLKQVWFAGDHSAIGGGIKEKAGLSDTTLSWMMEAIKDAGLGLSFDTSHVSSGINPNHLCTFQNETSLIGKLTGTITRPIDIATEVIHESVKRRWDESNYRPGELVGRFAGKLN
jgi:uncharacterized protein (DUF2235 family)